MVVSIMSRSIDVLLYQRFSYLITPSKVCPVKDKGVTVPIPISLVSTSINKLSEAIFKSASGGGQNLFQLMDIF